ncbi:ATP-dependent Clp protease adaptor ClpS [Lentzea alba]|uniref:ATP-dependent Clp protease adaptor ClpS n=1 Tax=Lentzea alba TaxID=2714351 RepID=UPI0039BEE0E3
MSDGDRWQVVVHNDDHNTFSVVRHLLKKVCGHDADTARALTAQVHDNGRAVAGTYDRATAEAITLRLVRFGLHAKFGRVR